MANIPPPAPEGEQHENDVLKRRKHFSWKKFGGEGFLVSVALHIILLILGLFWIVNKWREPAKKPEEFTSGSGGGANGDKAKQFEHRMQRRQPMIVKTPSRIVSKSATASVSLPSTPTTSTASFASGLSAGGMSKGSGGGSGGGQGTGIGIGAGGGRNFVSLFGARGKNVPGLPGVFYDMKQSPDRKPTKYAPGSAVGAFTHDVLHPFAKTWNTTGLQSKYYKAPETLVASQIFIPYQSAGAAPAAYGVDKEVTASRWLVHYAGLIKAPKTGKFRFWGLCDDVMVVRLNKKIALDSGWYNITLKNGRTEGQTGTRAGAYGIPFRAGRWISFEKGHEYPIELFLSELPGGRFGAWLLMEEADSSGKPDGNIFLFRMSDDPLPDGLRQDTGFPVDMTGKNLIWPARGENSRSIR